MNSHQKLNLSLKRKYYLEIKIITMTPSLANFLGSLFAGTVLVIIPITIALIVVSRLDPLSREEI
jgi:photosystem II PsbX protein